MKFIAFVFGFAAIAVLLVPHISASDPEPLGAEMSLYFFGLLPIVPSASISIASAGGRLIRHRLFFSMCTGALCSGFFYAIIMFAFPALSLTTTIALATSISIASSALVPRVFRPVPNKSVRSFPSTPGT
jgi:hypothetical protein